jgi:hypothetical protein
MINSVASAVGASGSSGANGASGAKGADGANGADGVNGISVSNGTIFSVADLTTGQHGASFGVLMPLDGRPMTGVDLSRGTDSYAVAPIGLDTYVLTGTGDDIISATGASGFCFIDAGSGNNVINASPVAASHFQADAASLVTKDTINGFNANDVFTLNGFFGVAWSSDGVNTTLTAVSADGHAPVTVVFNGIASPSMLSTWMGQGGPLFNITLAH